ncbi:hypothetical protein ACP70R_045414 [Stipagrostis hirtigluma subsp. patula]
MDPGTAAEGPPPRPRPSRGERPTSTGHLLFSACRVSTSPDLADNHLAVPVAPGGLGALLPASAAGNAFAAATVKASTIFADACRVIYKRLVDLLSAKFR